jgi:hypothetical protein
MQKSFKIQVQIVSMALKQMSHERQAKGEWLTLSIIRFILTL